MAPIIRKKRNYKRRPQKALKSNGIKALKPVINPALKKYVRSIVNKTEEIKMTTSNIAYRASVYGSGFNTTASTGYNTASSIIPVLYQGSGQSQRVGNKVRPLSFYIRGNLVALPVNATTNTSQNMPFYVRIVVWKQTANSTGLSNIQFLEDGITSGGVDFNGYLDDLMIPFNKDRYTIGAVRTIKLQPNSSSFTTNPENLSKFAVSKLFRMKVKLPKSLNYNDTALDPTNARWYLSAGIVNMDGSTLAATQIRCQITAHAVLKYRDA